MTVQNETLFIFITDLFPAGNVIDEVIFKNSFTVKNGGDGKVENAHGEGLRV